MRQDFSARGGFNPDAKKIGFSGRYYTIGYSIDD
jgi:hypothetical protein